MTRFSIVLLCLTLAACEDGRQVDDTDQQCVSSFGYSYCINEIVLRDGTKCAIASGRGVALSCDWSRK